MKIPIPSSFIRRVPRLSSLQIAKLPGKATPRESVKKFLADLRANYQARKKTKLPAEKKQRRLSVGYFILAFFTIMMIHSYYDRAHVETIRYSQFKTLLNKGLIAEVAVGETTIEGNMKGAAFKEILTPEKLKKVSQEVVEGKKTFPFETVRVEDPGLTAELEKASVPFRGEVTSIWLPTILSWVVPVALFFLLWSYIGKKMGSGSSGLMQIGKSKAKVYIEKATGVTFADVAGIDEAEEEVAEIVGFLKDPDKYQKLGGRIPKGVLIVGPPGTGKTLLARAVAGEAGVPFFSLSGSDFVEMFVGVGAARVRDMFQQAESKAPCIIFIDELDALGKTRGSGSGGGHGEREQTLNAALLRPGRFDRHVLVDRPDVSGRVDIIEVHLENIKVDSDVDVKALAAITSGFVGADLANMVNEAALLAARKGQKVVTMADFNEAVERASIGLEKKSRIMQDDEKLRV